MNDWDDIRFFLAVARQGSISGAARLLDVNHSTVSRRIQGFEEKHGVRLFNRQRDGYVMTDAADAIFEQAQLIETQNQQISRTLFGQDTRLEGPVNITMPHDIFEYCLAEDLAEFAKLYPGIALNLMVSKGLKDLSSREADLAIRLTASPPDYLVGRQVTGLQHALYAPADFNQPQTEEAVGLVLWTGAQEPPSWAKKHFPNVFIALQVDDLSSMYAAVKAGFGVARMPCYMPDALNGDDRRDGVKRLALPLPRSDWSVWVLNHVDLRKTARVQRCREFVLEALLAKRDLFEGQRSATAKHIETSD